MSKLLQNLTAVSRCGVEYRKQYLEAEGIPGKYGRFLLEVCSTPGISQEALSRQLLLDKSNITRHAATLEEDGYITRVPCPDDRRILRLYPSDKTQALLPHLTAAWDSWETVITKTLTPEECRQAAALLEKMKTAAREWMEVR